MASSFSISRKGVVTMKKSGKILNFIILLAGLAMIAYFFALGIFVRFGQSLSELWLLAGFLCIGRSCVWRCMDRRGKLPPKKPILLLRTLFCLCLAFFLLVEGVILAGGIMQPKQNLDYIVVLGAKVNGRTPSGALRNRIQRAKEYLQENPSTKAVLSGGQGADEEISEAQCMYERLVAGGIAPERLIIENQSTDTSENLRFSRELIPETDAQIGLVSNNFHIFRALATARGQGWEQVYGVPVATSLFSLPHYLMREFFGVMYDVLKGNLAF